MVDARERLINEGPLVPVVLAGADSQVAPVVRTFLVDTGADMTIIADELVPILGLTPARTTYVAGLVTTTPRRVRLYPLHLKLAGFEIEAEVCALPREDGVADGLVGRDVLAHFNLVYDGPNGAYELRRTS